MISYTIRISLVSQPFLCAASRLSKKKKKKRKLYPQDQVLEDQTYRCTHTFFTSLQKKVRCQERPLKISQDAHFTWHPDCDRDKSRMPVEQLNKKQVCSDVSLEQSFSCLQFLLKDLLQENSLEI